MKRLAGFCLAAALLAAGAGCEFGTGGPEGLVEAVTDADPTEPAAVAPTEPALTVPVTSAAPTGDTADDVAADEPATGSPAARPLAADCLDFSTGSLRLVPCAVRSAATNPVSHDDPDPWRPLPNAASPF